MKVLVTGGAGYIGSTVALALLDSGQQPIVLDDLSRGQEAYLRHFPHYVGDIADLALLDQIFTDHPDIEAAVHCAGATVVTDSLQDPLRYYWQNVAKTVELVGSLINLGCHRLIFSSSAAVYGAAAGQLCAAEMPVRPASPYAQTKVTVEHMLADVCTATPLTALSLRYFNPIGSDPQRRTGPYDPAPTDVMGSLLAAAGAGQPFWIHGRDWPTKDGTPVRDFVHVWDVALAHVAALRRWSTLTGPARHRVLDIGSGRGTTIRQLADAFNRVATGPVEIRYGDRRPGDIVGGYAATGPAEAALRWRPSGSVEDGVRDALRWSAQRRSAATFSSP